MTNQVQQSKRFDFLDIAKGLGIIFVFLGHTLTWEYVKAIIYNFHMPLFFFISGVFFKKKPSFGITIKYVFSTYFIPYFVFSLITIPFRFNFVLDELSFYHLYRFLIHGTPFFNVPLWFLVALGMCFIICSFVYSYIDKINNNQRKIYILLVLLFSFFLSLFCDRLPDYIIRNSPLMITSVPLCFFWYILGFFSSDKIKQVDEEKKSANINLLFVFCLILSTLLLKDCNADTRPILSSAKIGSILSFPRAISGVAIVLICSFLFPSCAIKRFLKNVGQNSMCFFALEASILQISSRIGFRFYNFLSKTENSFVKSFITEDFFIYSIQISMVIFDLIGIYFLVPYVMLLLKKVKTLLKCI